MSDDDAPRPRPVLLTPPDLRPFGVAELTDYVALLRAEIARVEDEIKRKDAQRHAAAALFKTPP
jgi:uncharacterized small protein (DUF1192 family)